MDDAEVAKQSVDARLYGVWVTQTFIGEDGELQAKRVDPADVFLHEKPKWPALPTLPDTP